MVLMVLDKTIKVLLAKTSEDLEKLIAFLENLLKVLDTCRKVSKLLVLLQRILSGSIK